MTEAIRVAVVDDDASTRSSLARLLKSAGIEPWTFSSAPDFLADPVRENLDCALLDVRMPKIDGLKLQEQLTRTAPHLSVVFLTGHGDVSTGVTAMKRGAADFLEKPVDGESLLAVVRRAAERSRALRKSHQQSSDLERRYARLSSRERQVFAMVTAGMLNKQVAYELKIVEKTIKVHRARVMQKMEAESLADLVRMADRLGVAPAPTRT
jgi:FixJ family two-component response regulator